METGVSEPAVAVLHQDDKPSCAAAAAVPDPVSFAVSFYFSHHIITNHHL
ncbi:unnamed protein product [Gongylonema pulchrum]|uniref:Uncharacterized protein n=1 Tax=Gongylonema pulchrum TaxID=637853 RepID=A0A183D5N1_9BILA|nr:unnamed protein product [Gongylonema pulchrum]